MESEIKSKLKVTLEATIIRADGRVEPLGVVSQSEISDPKVAEELKAKLEWPQS